VADVEVTFSAVDEGYSAAINKMRNEAYTIANAVPKALGGAGAPAGYVESGGRFYRQLTEEERDAARAANELADSQENAGQAAQRHGINFGRMMERMAISLVVFGAIREAIRGIQAAMAEATTFEAITTRFKNLTLDAANADKELAHIAETAKKIGASKEDMAALELSLQRGGASAAAAAAETETLAEYAAVGGEKMATLGDEMSRLEVGAGTVSDMEHLVSLMGEAGRELHDQIISYEREQVLLRQNEELIARSAQLQQRAIEETTRLEERSYEQQQRQIEAVTEFGDKLGIAKEVFEGMQRGEQHQYIVKAGVDVSDQAEFLQKREEAGERQLEQEENLGFAQLRRLEAAGLIDEKDLLAAARRRDEAAREEQKHKQEDARAQTRNAQEDAAYERRHDQEEESLKLQGKVFQAVKDRVGLTEHLAAVEKTAADQVARSEEKLKAAADHSKLVGEAIKSWNSFLADSVKLLEGVDRAVDKIRAGVRQWANPGTTAGHGPSVTPETQKSLELLERSVTAQEATHAAIRVLTTQ
jgi:hypothetical protein